MAPSSFLFIFLNVFLSVLGSLIQPSHSLKSVTITRSASMEIDAPYILASEVIFHSESTSEPFEASEKGSGGIPLQKLLNLAVVSRDTDVSGNEKLSGSGITSLTPTPAPALHHTESRDQGAHKVDPSIIGYSHSDMHTITEGALLDNSHVETEEQLRSSTSIVNDDILDGWNVPELPVQNNVFSPMEDPNLSGLRSPCELTSSPCVALTNMTGSNLLWDDMRRTLAFAWELHVFGSASLFILMAVLAAVGMAGACTAPHPLCGTLTLANSFLILGGTLRGVLLLLDPYGTRQILSHATLAALHNSPMQLLLWAQVAFALVPLRGMKLLLFPLKLQRPWVVGGLAVSHCTLLVVADLFSTNLPPTLPLLLQTLSLCWSLPFCMEILIKSFPHLNPVHRSSVPLWVPTLRIEKRARSVTVVCAFLGVLCCSLQMYSLLWLYGLLGNWKRFGWGWWLSQFWARILELAWGFSLLVLGLWIFWGPSNADLGQGKSEGSIGSAETSLWDNLLTRIRRGPLRNSEKNWEDFIPNNWTKYNLSGAGFSSNIMSPYDDPSSRFIREYKPEAVSNSGSDSQVARLWPKAGERECVLSLVELDMRPLSPINLRWSIDNALHHGQLVEGGLFTTPHPSWTQNFSNDTTGVAGGATKFPPAYIDHRSMMDTDSFCPSLDRFQARESIESPCATSDYNAIVGSPANTPMRGELNSELLEVIHLQDWAIEDVTDL